MRFCESKKPCNNNKTKGADTFEKFKIFTRFWCTFFAACVILECFLRRFLDDGLRYESKQDDEYHNNNKAAALLLLSNLFQRANGDSKGLGHGHQSNSSR